MKAFLCTDHPDSSLQHSVNWQMEVTHNRLHRALETLTTGCGFHYLGQFKKILLKKINL